MHIITNHFKRMLNAALRDALYIDIDAKHNERNIKHILALVCIKHVTISCCHICKSVVCLHFTYLAVL